MATAATAMPLAAVLDLIRLFEQEGIDVIIDGGWAVDAVLGRQSRSHADLDIALQHKDVPRLRALLEQRGYGDVGRDDSWEHNFVLGDNAGHEVDIHSFILDDAGQVVGGVLYPSASLTGHGVIGGRTVRCIPADWLVRFHSGYKLDENDYHDVKALCERFAIPIPADFADYERRADQDAPQV